MLRLIDLREDRDLTQSKIAEILHIDRAHYSKLELGVYNLTSDKLIILSNFYNTSIDYILGLTNDVNIHKRNDVNLHLLNLRKSNFLKSVDLAKILKISQPQYSDLENGISLLTHDKLIILSNFYNTSVDYILGLTDDVNPYPKPPFEIK